MAKKKVDSALATETAESPAPAEKITQKEAVKRAIAAGKDSPTEGVVYIKATFGIDLSSQAFSTLKSQLKSASGATAKRGPKPGVKAASSAGTTVGNNRAIGNAADLARSVKSLVEQHGAAAVAEMTKVFAD